MNRELLSDEADFVVVGTGAGGATAARVLSAAGHSVVMLEEGPNLDLANRPRELLPAMRDMFREAGTTAARGRAPFPLLQGRLVGGTTAINSGIIWRIPETVRRDWVEKHGLEPLVGPASDRTAIDDVFTTIEKDLGIAPTPEALYGGNSRVLRDGAKALGYAGNPTLRNTPGCKGSARCLQGCPNRAHQGMDRTYVPRALASGARLHALARVRRIRFEGGRAIGVTGDVVDPATRRPLGRLDVRARRGVIIAGGVIQTPLILRRSGVKGKAGDRFQAHPGTAVVARFPFPVEMGFGATQGYQIPLVEKHMKLESLAMPPEMLAARLPGAGAEWQSRLSDLDHYAQVAVMARMEAHGSVRPGFNDSADVKYEPTKRDLRIVQEGIAIASRMMFAAGAVEVFPSMAGRPEILTDVSQVSLLEQGTIESRDVHLLGTHLFGTACAGTNPNESVVDTNLEAHRAPGLFVMDASVFPTNIGVNPQHSIMGVVWRAAERLANRAA